MTRKKNKSTGMPYTKNHLPYNHILDLNKKYKAKGVKTEIYSIKTERGKKYAKLWFWL